MTREKLTPLIQRLSHLEVGQGVFVPCLDTAAMRHAVLMAAIPYRLRLSATAGIRKGLIGVWFCLLRSPPVPSTESSDPGYA